MKLTGKAKELFREYYDNLPKHTPNDIPYSTFIGMSESTQWGVIQDFADSLGYDMLVMLHSGKFMYLITNVKLDFWEEEFDFKTRQEARNAAIKKLNETINEK